MRLATVSKCIQFMNEPKTTEQNTNLKQALHRYRVGYTYLQIMLDSRYNVNQWRTKGR